MKRCHAKPRNILITYIAMVHSIQEHIQLTKCAENVLHFCAWRKMLIILLYCTVLYNY